MWLPIPFPRRRPPLHVGIIVAVLVVCLLLLGLDRWRTWQMRDAAISADAVETSNLARSLSQQAHDTFYLADMLVIGLRDRIEAGELSPDRIGRLERTITMGLPRVPALYGVAVFNAAGSPVAGERGVPGTVFTVGDRTYFNYHLNHADRGVLIGDVIRSRVDGQWSITVSRRIDDQQGRFAGVVRARISTAFLQRFYGSFAIGPHGAISLVTSWGIIVARTDGTGTARTGVNVSSGKPFRQIGAGAISGSIRSVSPVDGVERLLSFRRINDYPLCILVAHAVDDVLAGWRVDAGLHLVVSLLVSMALLLAGSRFARQVRIRQQVERRYRLLSENSIDAIVCLSLDGRRNYVSPAFTMLTGWSSDEAISGQCADILHPDDRHILAGVLPRLLAGSTHVTLCYRYVCKDGSLLWVEARAQLLPNGREELQVIANVRDITDRRAVEAVLQESQERYRLLADSTSDVIMCLDRQLRCTYSSPACRTVFGREPEQMLGIALQEAVHPEDAPEVLELVRPLLAEACGRTRVTCRIQHPTRLWVWVEATVDTTQESPSGDATSLIFSLRDISERYAQAEELQAANVELQRLARHLARARDQANKANQAKTRFLAGMSHELRTPLNGILGYAELLRLEGDLNAKQVHRTGAMLEAGEHLLQMINRILSLSEIETETVRLNLGPIDVTSLAHACIDLVEPVARSKGLRLDLAVAPNTPDWIVGDLGRLKQIVLNLLGNAIKFTSHGYVELRLQPATEFSVRIEVVDTGPGIPIGLRSRLFQEFQRLSLNGSKIEGAGLGLALSAQLATALKTSIEHRDNPSGGSVFWLDLPSTSNPGPIVIPVTDRSCVGARPEPARRLQVLVVDDMAMNRDITSSFLRPSGHEIMLADGGAEAVRLASIHDFDIVLMDVQMPEVDGLDATRQIRLLSGTKGKVPIVAVTAQAFGEQIEQCYAAGMEAHLTKPFKQEALLTLLERLVVAPKNPDTARSSSAGQGSQDTIPGETPDGRCFTAFSPDAHDDRQPMAFNMTTFDSIVAILSPDAITSYLSTIRDRGESLLQALQEQDHPDQPYDALGSAAHVLAGSAGMFGFEQLASTARSFEHVLKKGEPIARELVDGLSTELKFLIQEIGNRRPALSTS